MTDSIAIHALQDAVSIILNQDHDCTVSDALIRIIQAAAHDLEGFAAELTPWEAE